MGMTIEEYESSDLMTENEFLRKQLAEALKHRRMFEADYENRLKADMVVMLEELLSEVNELCIDTPLSECEEDMNRGIELAADAIQQKINKLKG